MLLLSRWVFFSLCSSNTELSHFITLNWSQGIFPGSELWWRFAFTEDFSYLLPCQTCFFDRSKQDPFSSYFSPRGACCLSLVNSWFKSIHASCPLKNHLCPKYFRSYQQLPQTTVNLIKAKTNMVSLNFLWRLKMLTEQAPSAALRDEFSWPEGIFVSTKRWKKVWHQLLSHMLVHQLDFKIWTDSSCNKMSQNVRKYQAVIQNH